MKTLIKMILFFLTLFILVIISGFVWKYIGFGYAILVAFLGIPAGYLYGILEEVIDRK